MKDLLLRFSKKTYNQLFVVSVLSFLALNTTNFSYSQMESKVNQLNGFDIRETKNLEIWKEFNQVAYYSHPEFGKLPQNAPCDSCVEVLEKRTIDERFFVSILDRNEFYTQKALGDLHQLVNGQWVSIEHELHPVSETRYESGYLLDQTIIDFSAARTELKTANGTLRFNNWKLIVVQNEIETNQYPANWSDYTVGSDGTLIHNIFPGIDAEMIVFRGAIKTSFIIKTNEFGAFDDLVFREELEGLSSVHAQFSEGSHNRGIGSLKLIAGSTELAVMDEAKLFAKDGPKSLARSGEYEIHANKIDLIVDYDWINENIGSYQLVVDPLVTGTATLAQASITGSRYNASCNFTNSCDYNLTVPFPANATLTDVTFSFSYSASGICWREDGAMRITSGSCVSPSNAGFYWFCNLMSGGVCNAANQTVYPDLVSCMPGPSCAIQNIPFTLQFFRACYGSTGCSNTCIGANAPWVMNMIGRTLEYTNNATPITLSATTVCQGGSITATTSGTGGVPGYTYNWSFSPTGTPSVGTGASTSISFPTSGSITLYSIVTDACGNQVTNSRTVTVTPGTPPTITAGGPTTFCAGGSVTLTSSSVTGNTWSTGATTQSITVTASGSYTVTVLTGSCTTTSVATVVTVTPLPATPTITASGPTTFCAGGSVTLTSSSVTGNLWSTTETTQSIIVSTSGTYSLTVSAGGCTSASASTTVTVNPVPVVPTITAGGPTTFCAGGSVVLTSSSTTGNTWSTTETTQVITVTTSGSYTVTVSNGSCSANSVATIVTVNPLPATPTITAGGPTTFCTGGSVVLTSSSTTGNTWSTGATTQSITVTTGGAYTVTVSNGACSATSAATTVLVNPLPPVPTITANGPTTFCTGGSVILTSSAATGNTWSTGATTQSITVTSSGSYTVTVSNGSCSATSTATSVTVNPLPPVPTIGSGGPATFCAGGSVVLTSSSTTGNTWSTGETTQSITVTTGGSYTVTVSVNGCSSTSSPTLVTVNPLPTVTASNNGPLCVNQALNLTASGTAGSTYSWSGPNGFSSTVQNPTIPSITNGEFGIYTVTATLNNCSASTTTTVTLNSGNSTAIVPAGPFCVNGLPTVLSAASPGGNWTGIGIVNTSTGLFDPTVSGVGSFVITYDIPGSCSGSSTATIIVNSAPLVNFAADTLVGCVPLAVQFTNSLLPGVSSLWNFGNGQTATTPLMSSALFTAAGCYTISLTVTDVNGCATTSSKADMICIHPEANASFIASPQDATITRSEVHFINTSTNATAYSWNFGDGGNSILFSPTHTYDEVASNYTVELIATNTFGCSDTSRLIVRVLDELVYFIPNAFSPDGDEFNNTFQPVFTSGFDPYSFNMRIFNRWGETLFESNDPKVGWDGTYQGVLVQEGVYSWTVSFKDSNSDKKYSDQGHLSMIK